MQFSLGTLHLQKWLLTGFEADHAEQLHWLVVCTLNGFETCFHGGRLRHADLDGNRRATRGDEIEQACLRVPRRGELFGPYRHGFHVSGCEKARIRSASPESFRRSLRCLVRRLGWQLTCVLCRMRVR